MKLKQSASQSTFIIFPFLFSVLLMAVAVLGEQNSLETRARNLENHIMAPCCFGGTLSQHAESPLTVDMKGRIRLLLRQGMSDDQVIDFMVQYYGKQMNLPPNQWERIRATPQTKGVNLLAWLLPGFAFLVGGVLIGLILRRFVRRQKQSPAPENHTISPQMEERIARELDSF